jgi:hypothetical protein
MVMDSTTCGRCGAANDDGGSFCAACGASLAPQIHCPGCNTMNALGKKFCTRCGGSLEYAGWGEPAEPGAVIDGVWERGGDELIRRVDPEDARRFLGARTVRVPASTVGVVLVDGVVARVLPPGERTSTSLFQRIASFFVQRERTAFYLVDQRPFLVPFVIHTRPSSSGQVVKTQVLVTLTLPKGDRDALASFIANVVRERPSVSTGELYNLLRPEVARTAQDVLERAAAAGEVSYADAEVEIRHKLGDALGRRYGLTADATLAPLTAITSLTLSLGTGLAPTLRTCAACRAELPAQLKFCDHCGAAQPVGTVGTGPAGAAVDKTGLTAEPSGPYHPSLASLADPTGLYTSDGQQVELDLVVRIQGQHEDATPARVAPAVVSAVAAHLRAIEFRALVAPGGLGQLEQAIGPQVTEALRGFGMTLVALVAVDARSKTGQWVLAARADLERATEDLRLGLQWLEQRDHELDLEQLTLTRVLREQQQRRDHAFASDDAATVDRERRDGLAARQAALEVTVLQRDAQTVAARDAAVHERARRDAAHATELRKTQVDAELAELRARRTLDLEDTEHRKRLELELSALAEQQQIDKLRQMAQIDRETAAADHAHELEKRAGLRGLSPDEMIAMQAGELARSAGGGAAWAAVLASRADVERRHAEDTRGVYDKAMAAMAEVAKSRAEAAPVMATPAIAVGVAGPVSGQTAARTCASCGAAMKSDARFCGTCGATT